ncbi:hypothetical protein ACLKA6_013511 [Drosophila palustris]
MSSIERALPELDCSDLDNEWLKWKTTFLLYLMASGKDMDSEPKKIATFLWLAGAKNMEMYNTLFPNDGSSSGIVGVVARATATSPPAESPSIPDSEASTSAAAMQALTSARTLEVVIAAFDDYCVPYKNLTMASFKFHNIVQAIMGENEEEHDEKLQLVLARAKENGASRQHAQRNTVGPSRPLRPALAADSRQGQQRPPPKKAPLPGRGEPGGVDDPHRRTLCGSRTKWYIRYLQQGMSQEDALAKAKEPRPTTSGDRTPAKRSSSALTPPTDTPKRVRAAEPTAQRPGAANPVRAEHRAPKEGRQEARDERPSTSKAAAAAEPTARESTSSAPTEPRTSYAAVASKVKVAVLPVDYPQVILSHGELSALEEAILDQVILTGGLKRVAERDGMRAAPAPPEATALASEDPPPTGVNLETSPAVSGSSVCPAGPSDSLEDLAEDEDLADLTLDPAAVEEIDEQMAMSSQELHEELEGADVTLTPCDDEGNSRPPSSCDMEPLL